VDVSDSAGRRLGSASDKMGHQIEYKFCAAHPLGK
jgi:hypothetical protein